MRARQKIARMVGEEVEIKKGKESVTWKVVESHEVEEAEERAYIGVRHIYLHREQRDTMFASLFLHLAFPDWCLRFVQMNRSVAEWNKNKASFRKKKEFDEEEFLVGLGLIIGAAGFPENGIQLFTGGDKKADDNLDESFMSIVPKVNFGAYMNHSRFKEFHM